MNRSAIVIAAMCVSVAGCDTVTDSYETIADARADRLFERGWLPDLLPPSARGIRLSNDLDINISEGEFTFVPDEFQPFHAKLTAGPPNGAPFSDWAAFIQSKEKQGYVSAGFQKERSTWVFMCHEQKGHCVYRMWLERAG